MADNAWKAYERRVAKMFGMERALQKGTKAKEDIAPEEGIDAAPWIIDCKKRKRLAIWKWMAELVKYASKKGKPPILAFQPFGKKQSYAIVRRDWFDKTFRSYYSCFYQCSLSKGISNFEDAWSEVKVIAKRTNNLPMLHLCPSDKVEYTCIKLENLISMMRAKNMLKENEDV